MAREKKSSRKFSFDLYVPEEKRNLPDVILIHSWSSAKEVWKLTAQTIANGTHRNVYALDLRNHESSIWSDEYSYEIMAEDMGHFMEENNIDNAAFVGFSMGGTVAMLFALSEPSKVCKLIIEDTSPAPWSKSDAEGLYKVIDIRKKCLQLIPPEADFSTAKTFILEVHRNEIRNIENDFPPFYYDFALVKKNVQYAWNFNIDVLSKIIQQNLQNKIYFSGSYEKPSLFIYGEESSMDVSSHSDLIYKYFPKAVLSKFEGAGHLISLSFPEKYCQLVTDFLNNSDTLR